MPTALLFHFFLFVILSHLVEISIKGIIKRKSGVTNQCLVNLVAGDVVVLDHAIPCGSVNQPETNNITVYFDGPILDTHTQKSKQILTISCLTYTYITLTHSSVLLLLFYLCPQHSIYTSSKSYSVWSKETANWYAAKFSWVKWSP